MTPLAVTSVDQLIGQTPLLRLSASLVDIPLNDSAGRTWTLRSELYAKVEFMNPGGSIKDRIARQIVIEAEGSGRLKPGGTIVEATSGNTGAGLAVMAASRGYKAVFVMPDKMSAEKINALRAFGARVVITPTAVEPDHPDYYCNVARRLSESIPGAFLANQYFNPDNPRAHELSTGPEIWDQMQGRVDAFVAGIGTGGTLSGTARFLRSKNPKLRVVAADPRGSIYSGLIRDKKASPAAPYLVEGVGEDMVPGTMDLAVPDDCVTVTDAQAFAATRMLAQREGLLVGGSCGLAFYAAVDFLIRHEQAGGAPLRTVVILPDSGSRYLSKVFNPAWLESKEVSSGWGAMSLGGAVEFLPSAKKVEGV
jgi:cystathionine beta-synthase